MVDNPDLPSGDRVVSSFNLAGVSEEELIHSALKGEEAWAAIFSQSYKRMASLEKAVRELLAEIKVDREDRASLKGLVRSYVGPMAQAIIDRLREEKMDEDAIERVMKS